VSEPPDFAAIAAELAARAPETIPPPPPDRPRQRSMMEVFALAGRAAVRGQPVRTAAESAAFVAAGRAAVAIERRGEEPRRGTQRRRALDAVRRWPGRTSAELSELDGCTDRYLCARRLPELLALGLVRREQADGEWRWWPL